MTVSLKINSESLDRVNRFKYLGAGIEPDTNLDKEMKCRIGITGQRFMRFKQLSCDPKLNLNLRLMLVKCYVWSILLYGAEHGYLKHA